jgi:hypothetical protein
MQSIHRELDGTSGIRAVETNTSTGSVVVHYDPAHQTTDGILAVLKDVGIIVRDIGSAGEEPPEVGHSATSEAVLDAVTDLNRRLYLATGGKFDLKLLFPLGMGAIGLWKVLRSGLELGEVPAYVLLWYAFDAFHKLHVQTPVTAEDTGINAGPGEPLARAEA